MKTNRLTLIAAAGIVIPASAFTIYSGAGTPEFKGRSEAVKAVAAAPAKASVAQFAEPAGGRTSNMVVKVAPKQADAQNPFAEYGELIPVLEEDFSKMTSGSVGAPDMTTKIWNEIKPGDIAWTNLKPEYTKVPNWGAYHVYQAGGSLFMDQSKPDNMSHLNTPYNVDLTANDGICVITFEVTSKDENTGIKAIMIEAAETHNMGPQWTDLVEPQVVQDLAPGSHSISCLFYGGGPSTMFNINPMKGDAFYVDNLKIYTLKQNVAIPKLLKHSEYKGTSFKANWEAVEGADSYLVSVYSLNSTDPDVAPTLEYVVEDKPATENSLVIDGVKSGVTYYYTVKAVKGDNTSLPSLPMRVFDIETPKALEPAVAMDELSYKAFWEEVPKAERYNYIAYRLLTAEADGPFVIADEQFTGITNPDGISCDWTFDDPDPEAQVYNDLYITTGMTQRGWHAKNAANYYNSLCIDAFHYIMSGEDSGLISPELDLSKDGGKFTVTITAAGEFLPASMTGLTDQSGKPVDTQVEAAVAVFNYDEKVRDYVQSELIYAHDVNKEGMSPSEMRTFTFNLTKGGKRSIIGIYAVGGPGNLYLDDFKVVQNYKAGETFYDPFEFQHWYDGKQIDVKLPLHAVSYEIYDQVQAVRGEPFYGQTEFAVSEFSPRALVFKSTVGVDKFTVDDNTTISLNAGVLTVNTPGSTTVYGIDGSLVAASQADGEFSCTLPAKGIYLVKTADKTVKVIY